jgi:hypothetical protein
MTPIEVGGTAAEIPAGRHNVTITEARTFETKDKGTPGLGLTLVDDEGREAEVVMWTTRAAEDRLEELWDSAGLEWPWEGGTVDEADLVGKRVHVDLITAEFKGKTRLKVNTWSRPEGSDVPADDEDLRPSDEPEEGGDEDDSDVPF